MSSNFKYLALLKPTYVIDRIILIFVEFADINNYLPSSLLNFQYVTIKIENEPIAIVLIAEHL